MTPPGQSAAMIAVADTRAPAQRLITSGTPGAAPAGRISRERPQSGRSRRLLLYSVPVACAAGDCSRESHPHHRHQDVVCLMQSSQERGTFNVRLQFA